MLDELVYPQDISKEMLYLLLEGVYFECELDSDGDVLVYDPITCLVKPVTDNKQILLRTGFQTGSDATREEKLEVVNRINDEKLMIRAIVEKDDAISFDYFIPTDGGITKGNIVRSIRRFTALVRAIVVTPEVAAVFA